MGGAGGREARRRRTRKAEQTMRGGKEGKIFLEI